MIKTYMPNALMLAATDIAKVHSKETGTQVLTESELENLLERIARCKPENLPVLALGLLSKEIYALCRYLPHNKYKKPVEKITKVIGLVMKPCYFEELFLQWQKHPANRTVLQILAEHDNGENQAASFRIPTGYFAYWYSCRNCYAEIMSYIGSVANSADSFDQQFEAAGFRVGFPLQTECLRVYLMSCDFRGYLQTGDKKIASCVRKATTADAEKILLNLLLAGHAERTRLAGLKKCCAVMLDMWREPYSNRFPQNQPEAQRVYFWLYNYTEMLRSFSADADFRRRNFWENYLDRCEITKLNKHRMLIFNFENYCSIEFEVVGRIFVYEKTYFAKTVRPRAQQQHSTQELKSWMLNDSKYVYEKRHLGRWEPEVSFRLRRYI